MWQDVRYGLRGMQRTPLLTCAMVLTLAVGIGLNSGTFTLIDAALFRAPVEKNPSTYIQPVASYAGWYRTEELFDGFTALDYQAMRDRSQTVTDLAAWHGDEAALENETAKTGVTLVTCNFFSLYGLDLPKLGRLFRPEECATSGTARVAILGETFWKHRFAADPQIVGKAIRLNGHPYTVVGVVPAGFAGMEESGPGIWVPYTMQPDFWQGHDAFKKSDWYGWAWLTVGGRLKQGRSRRDAQAELNVIVQQQDHLYPGSHENASYSGRRTTVVVTNGSIIENPHVRSLAILLIALVMGPLLLVLLIACANVTMLLLSRAAARRDEIAVRLALGALRARLLSMLATEGVMVALAGGAISAALAVAFPTIVRWFLPDLPMNIKPNWAVFGYLAGVTFMAGCIAGLTPAVESLKVDLVTTLKQQHGASPARSGIRAILMIGQVGMSFVLLAGAALFVHLQYEITAADPGFDTAHVFLLQAGYLGPDAGSNTRQERNSTIAFYTELAQRIRGLPGVKSVAFTQALPFMRTDTEEVRVPGQLQGQGRQASVDVVSANFFETLGIPVVRGRPFRNSDVTEQTKPPADDSSFDAETISPVAVVSQAFARAFWPGQDPIGKVVEWGGPGRRAQVVGVARDTRSDEFGQVDGPRLYGLMNWDIGGPLMVRFEGRPDSLAPAIERAVRSVDEQQLVVPRTLRSLLEERAKDLGMLTDMVSTVACFAVVLAVIGIYGVVAFSTSQRAREFGIRMVLGASKGRIMRSVLISGTKQIGMGLSLGGVLAVPASVALARLFARSTLKVQTFDLSAYAMAALLLLGVALVAMYVPARRASKVDPMVALRYQ